MQKSGALFKRLRSRNSATVLLPVSSIAALLLSAMSCGVAHQDTPDEGVNQTIQPNVIQPPIRSNRSRCHWPRRFQSNSAFIRLMAQKVLEKHRWSFDTCVGRARREHLFPTKEIPCTKTLYAASAGGTTAKKIKKYLESDLFPHLIRFSNKTELFDHRPSGNASLPDAFSFHRFAIGERWGFHPPPPPHLGTVPRRFFASR